MVTPTRQEVIDLMAFASKYSSGQRSRWDTLISGINSHTNPNVCARLRVATKEWSEDGKLFADSILTELEKLNAWMPTQWNRTVSGYRAQLLPIWKSLDDELLITHVLFIEGRRLPPVGTKVGPLTVLASRHRHGVLPSTRLNRARRPGYYTEVQLFCPVATAQKTAAIARGVKP